MVYPPRLIDLEPYDIKGISKHEAIFTKKACLTNYSGFAFDLSIERKIKILSSSEITEQLGLNNTNNFKMVGYQTTNTLTNKGKTDWKKETGLLSIWLLGMFNPSPTTTIIIPYVSDWQGGYGKVVNVYESFAQIPSERLIQTEDMIFFKGDGQYRSKIGLLPSRAKDVLGAYDSKSGVLTVVKYNKPVGAEDYVNSLWKIQDNPYRGDVVNSYNDGPPEPGIKPLGAFYELETSSPAMALASGKSGKHAQMTFHFEGKIQELDKIIKKAFGINVTEIPSFGK